MGPKKRKLIQPEETSSTKFAKKEMPEGDLILAAYLWSGSPKCAIPVSPVFQVEVPDFSEVLDLQCYRDKTAQWLGIRAWPFDGLESIPDAAVIGRGRPSSCDCGDPGSEECVKRHVSKRRAQLRHELGYAFEAWKFNEMGENVANSWSGYEERILETIVSERKDFLDPKTLWKVSKTRKEIISYYFNVLVPRRISTQTRRGKLVESDDDDEENQRMTRTSQNPTASSKYLRPYSA